MVAAARKRTGWAAAAASTASPPSKSMTPKPSPASAARVTSAATRPRSQAPVSAIFGDSSSEPSPVPAQGSRAGPWERGTIISSVSELHLRLESPAATRTIGRALAARIAPDDLLLLHGPLGAGKTARVQATAEAL